MTTKDLLKYASKISIICLLFFTASLLYANQVLSETISYLSSEKSSYPEIKKFGKIKNINNDKKLLNFSNELKKPFDLEWAERNFNNKNKKTVSYIFSHYLADMLPAQNVLFKDDENINKDSKNTLNIVIQNNDKVKIFTFILNEDKIEALHRIDLESNI